MVEVSGFKFYAMAGIMMIAGLAMVFGKTCSEKLAVKIKPLYLTAIMLTIMLASSLMIVLMAESPYAALILMFVGVFGFSGIVLPEQKMGEASSETTDVTQSALYLTTLSIGNAVGATIGALPMAMGHSVEFAALPAVIILSSALGILYYIYKTAPNLR